MMSTLKKCLTIAFASAAAWGVFPGESSAQTIPEIQVSTQFILDFEFDWGRDGVYCSTCNFGDSNARLTWTDPKGDLWIAHIDPDTGAFVPTSGRGYLAGINAAYAAVYGNGSEWMLSSMGSQIVYTNYVVGTPKTAAYISLGKAVQTSINGWTAGPLANSTGEFLPLGSLDLNDPDPRIVYQDKNDGKAYERPASNLVPEESLPAKGTCARRWVGGQNAIIYTSPCFLRNPEKSQVYLWNIDADTTQQLTFDSLGHQFAFMWQAPEYNNDYVFLTVAALDTLQIYHQTGPTTFVLVNTITTPPAMPYIGSPEPFVHNGKSYIFMSLSSSPDPNNTEVPTQLALTGIVPGVNSFKMLTNDNSIQRLRLDPEYYITSQGPFIYYNRYFPGPSISTIQNEGVWRVDSGLGPPVTH